MPQRLDAPHSLVAEEARLLHEARLVATGLCDLWGEARTVLKSVETTTPEYDAVRDVVQEFADMDPDSFSFRYPMKKDQTATVPSGTPNLNWAQFHVTMSAVANFLEAAQCELDVRVDYVIDRNAEASRNEYS